jgi:hypothetical protein
MKTFKKNTKPVVRLILFIPFYGLLVLSSCKKTKTPPPGDPFASLNNQLVCKINGSEWRSNERWGGFFYLTISGKENIRLVYANGRDDITIYINKPYNKSFYIFNNATQTYPNIVYPKDYLAFDRGFPDLTPPENYVTNTIDTGRVDIVLLDSFSNYIKGKFFFTGKDSRTGKKITVTDGYFHYYRQ